MTAAIGQFQGDHIHISIGRDGNSVDTAIPSIVGIAGRDVVLLKDALPPAVEDGKVFDKAAGRSAEQIKAIIVPVAIGRKGIGDA